MEASEKRTIKEVKHRPGKSPLEWERDLVAGEAGKWARIRFVTEAPQTVHSSMLPSGTAVSAIYWTDRPFHVWSFTKPDGGHAGYRFDVCTSTFIWREKLIWYDLEMDLWIAPNASPEWQDEDDMRRLVRMEHLSQDELDIADQARAYLDAHWEDVIREAVGEVLK